MEWKISHTPVDYTQALEFMEQRVLEIAQGTASEMVWLLEHKPLYTAGTSAKPADLLEKRFPTYPTGRGGEWTYHGPGQRIAYVMLDLNKRGRDVRRYVQQLEGWIIATLGQLGVEGFVREGRVGVWVQDSESKKPFSLNPESRIPAPESKIAALGIRVRKWVSYHGVALNVAPDLSHYQGIVPCGISGYGVTSLAALGVRVEMAEVDAILQREFARAFISP